MKYKYVGEKRRERQMNNQNNLLKDMIKFAIALELIIFIDVNFIRQVWEYGIFQKCLYQITRAITNPSMDGLLHIDIALFMITLMIHIYLILSCDVIPRMILKIFHVSRKDHNVIGSFLENIYHFLHDDYVVGIKNIIKTCYALWIIILIYGMILLGMIKSQIIKKFFDIPIHGTGDIGNEMLHYAFIIAIAIIILLYAVPHILSRLLKIFIKLEYPEASQKNDMNIDSTKKQ